MDAYIFQAALICEPCCLGVQGALPKPAHVDMHDESSYDSDEWPKGPYSDGGGEADTPQHCDMCGQFLDNALTGDGENYVIDAFRDYVYYGDGALDVLKEWRSAYDWCYDHVVEITVPTWEDEGNMTPARVKRLAELDG